MSPDRLAEHYILHLIEELDDATADKLLSSFNDKGSSYRSIDQFMEEYEAAESIYVDLIEWVREEWSVFQKNNDEASAKKFAKSRVSDFLASLT